MEEKRYTTEEWKELIGPVVKQAFTDTAARRKLIHMHRNPAKTTKTQAPWATGETCFVTIDSHSFKVAILSPDGQYRCLEFNRRGRLVRDSISDGSDQGQL